MASQWSKEILTDSPPGETRAQLVDRVLEIEANRCAEILDGCASRHKGIVATVLEGMSFTLRHHLGPRRTEKKRDG